MDYRGSVEAKKHSNARMAASSMTLGKTIVAAGMIFKNVNDKCSMINIDSTKANML